MKLSIIGRIGVISQLWKRYLQKQLLPHNITLKQIYLLKQLIRFDFLYPARIAELLFCDRPTASVIIGNLVKRGWVQKKPDSENKKRVRISITLLGAKKVNQVLEAGYAGDKSLDLKAVLTNREMKDLDGTLIKLEKIIVKMQ
jgi:DNA-binding MarR family transcriptional regulator